MNVIQSSYLSCMEHLAFKARSKARPGERGQRGRARPGLTPALLLPPGLPHDDACLGDGDQRLPVSHRGNGGAIYIPGTTQRSLQGGGSKGHMGKRNPGVASG